MIFLTKTKAHILSLIIILLCCQKSSTAQISGYMGKKCSVTGSVAISPAILRPSKVGQSSVGLNKTFGIGADYVVGRKVSLGAEYSSLNTAFTHWYNLNSISGAGDASYDFKLTSNTVSFYYRRFSGRNGNFLAPLGRFIQFGVLFGTTSASDVNGLFYKSPIKFYNAGTAGISFSWGRQRIFFNMLVMNYTIQFAYLTQGKDSDTVGTAFSSEVSKRLMGAYFVNAKLSLGLLAF